MKKIILILLLLTSFDAFSQGKFYLPMGSTIQDNATSIDFDVLTNFPSVNAEHIYINDESILDIMHDTVAANVLRRMDSVKYVSPVYSGDAFNYTFSTLQSAIDWSGAGTLIVVAPGDYAEQITLKNGVNIYLHKGANLNYKSNNSGYLLRDNNLALACGIYGEGTLERTSSDANAIGIKLQANSYLEIYCNTLKLEASASSAVLLNTTGNLTVKANNVLLTSASSGLKNYARMNVEADSCYVSGSFTNYTGQFYLKSNVLYGSFNNNASGSSVFKIGKYIGSDNTTCFTNSGMQTITIENCELNAGRYFSSSGGIQRVSLGIFSRAGTTFASSNPVFETTTTGEQIVNAEKFSGVGTMIDHKSSGSSHYDIKENVQTDDSGHCLRVTAGTVYYTGNKMLSAAKYSVVNMTAGTLYMRITDSMKTSGDAPVIETALGSFVNVKCSYMNNNGSSQYSQTVIAYGTGIIEADEIKNEADTTAVCDIKSTSFIIKNSALYGDTPEGIISIGATGLKLDNCREYNANGAGYSMKSYSGSFSVTTIFNYSNVPKHSNVTENKLVDFLAATIPDSLLVNNSINNKGSLIERKIRILTSDDTIRTTDRWIQLDASGTSVFSYLPLAATCKGFKVQVTATDINNSAKVFVVDSDVINSGLTEFGFVSQWQTIELTSDSLRWVITGYAAGTY